MLDYGSGQGSSAFCNRPEKITGSSTGIAEPIPRIAEKRERSPGLKDDVSGCALVTILHGIKKIGYNEKAPGWGYQGQKGSSVDDRNYHAMDRAKINSADL